MRVKILCVCNTNACESPMMKKFLTECLKKEKVHSVVESAGLYAAETISPSRKTQQVMKERFKLSLRYEKAQYVYQLLAEVSSFTHVIVVSEKVKTVMMGYGFPKAKIIILNEHGGGIPNPFNQSMREHEACAALIRREIKEYVKMLAN